MYINMAKFLNNILRHFRKKLDNKISGVRRVYTYDELGLNNKTTGGFWDVKNIDEEPQLVEKIYNHIRYASDIRVFCNRLITMSCDTARFGIVKVVMQPSLAFFEFCVYSTGTRYDVNYSIMRHEHSEFESWLQNNVLKYYLDFQKDKNL